MAKPKKETFEGELLAGHKGGAVEVPFDPEEKWAINARPPWRGRRGHIVQAKLKGLSFGSCVVRRSRKFWLLIDADVKTKVGVDIGDRIRITVEPHEDRPV